MIKAALIDLDGTILDSMGMWDTLGEDILHSLGFTSEDDLNEIFKSFTVKQAAQYYYDHFPVNLTPIELEKIITTTIEEKYLKEIPLKKGVKSFLEKLKKRDIALALVTTTNSFLSKKALERLEILDYFKVILSCDDLNCSKNESTIYDRALEELNVKRDEVIVLEDALHAIKTAKDNDYYIVGIFDTNVLEQEEIRDLADYYLEDFNDSDDLIDLIEKGIR